MSLATRHNLVSVKGVYLRFYKVSLTGILALTIVMLLTVAIAYTARITIISSMANDYLAAQQSELTCLKVNVDADFNIVIGKLCLQAPFATIEITDVVIDWQPAMSLLLPELINRVTINVIKVQGTAEIWLDQPTYQANQPPISPSPSLVTPPTNNPPFSDLPLKIKQVMAVISPLKVPVPVEIKRINYQPFSPANSSESISYLARFSANAQTASLIVTTAEDIDVISIKLFVQPVGFNADLNADLNVDLGQLTAFLARHQLPLLEQLAKQLPESFSKDFSDKGAKNLSVAGKLHSQLTWHKEALTISSQLSDLLFNSATDLEEIDHGENDKSEPFTIAGDLQWQSRWFDNSVALEFDNQSQLKVDVNQQKVIDLFLAEHAPLPLIELLKDNDLNQLDIRPSGSFTVDFAQAELFITQLGLKAQNSSATAPITFTLKDTFLNYALKPTETKSHNKQALNIRLQQTNFSLAAPLYFSALHPLSMQPAIIAATGVIKQNQGDWQIELASGSQITLSALSLSSSSGDQADVSAANLLTKIQGTINIVNNTSTVSHTSTAKDTAKDIAKITEQHHQKYNGKNTVNVAENISLDLTLSSELTRVKLANVIQLERVLLTADISGNSENMSVNGQVHADNVAVATINISGALAQPKLEVLANEVLVTDLLALNVNFPVDVKLIDGRLSYHLFGQLADFAKSTDESTDVPTNNSMTLAISIQELTGEIDTIWLQDLNWQQTFSLEKGLMSSLPQDQDQDQDQAKENNLSIALIESAVPIENFSAQTQLTFKAQGLALVAQNIAGETLGGSFNIANVSWPFQAERSVDVQLNSIDLEKLLELDQQQGIVITGKISGNLPVYLDGQQWLIKEGELHNVSNGIIQVMNNTVVAELKANSPELKLAFDALQNLHYHQLSSVVSMADDGYMLLATVIKGRNPELDNEVNLNLNLNYDLLGLLQSLDITKQVEKRIIKHSKQ